MQYPTGNTSDEKTEPVDEFFIPRIIMLCVMSLSALLGGVLWFVMKCVQPVYAKQSATLYHGINYGNYQPYKGSWMLEIFWMTWIENCTCLLVAIGYDNIVYRCPKIISLQDIYVALQYTFIFHFIDHHLIVLNYAIDQKTRHLALIDFDKCFSSKL